MTVLPSYDSDVAPVAALIADPTRAAMLAELLDGRAIPAGELGRRAGVSAATASAHLARLLAGGLVTVRTQGRHRYYQLAGPDVAGVLEALARISPDRPVRNLRQSREARALRAARTCYDHLAGRAGVVLLRALVDGGHLTQAGEPGDVNPYIVTPAGEEALRGLGVDVDGLRRQRRPLTRACIDWTERRPHLAGGLGAALTSRLIELGWFTRPQAGRALRLTGEGRERIEERFGCLLGDDVAAA
jgi:DNA-binding transcriptional ArsR family regulator